MKLFIFLLGIVIGVAGYHYYLQKPRPATEPEKTVVPSTTTTTNTKPSLIDQARDGAVKVKDAVADKLVQWHLTPEDIKADLKKTGEVVRTKSQSAGETIGSAASKARVISVINAKYTLDSQLSARTIDVDFNAGRVTLSGTVASHDLIGRAIALALETEGVTEVKSSLTVKP